MTRLLPLAAPSRVYAGIGSRETPAHVLDLMRRFAAWAATEGWTLRTGRARGADDAFELGALEADGAVETYLPWPGYGSAGRPAATLDRPTAAAYRIAAGAHPSWVWLSAGAKSLHARNSHIVLGADLVRPVAFVLCWTPDGAQMARECSRATGGTGQGIRLAEAHAPVLNLARRDVLAEIERVTS